MRRLILSACLILAGCNVAKREVAKLQVYAVRYPGPFKELANTLDPCFTGKAKSDTVVKHDTTTTPGTTTTTIVHHKDTVIVNNTIKLPGKVITNTVTVHDTIADQRAQEALKARYTTKSDSLMLMNGKYIQSQTDVAGWRKWFWILAGILIAELLGGVAYVIIKIYSKVP